MKSRALSFLAIGAGLVLAAVPVFAHHSFAAEYDAAKPVTLTGAVTKVEWANPHVRFHADVSDDSGKTVSWEFEMGGPNALMRLGWTRDSLKPGDKITVDGFLAKDGSHLVNAKSVNLSDGRKVFAGSSGDGSPTR